MELQMVNTTALAYIGDAVYEIYVRKHVLAGGEVHVDKLHRMAIRYVQAAGQARAVRQMLRDGFLTAEEARLVKRARNHKSASKPKNADPIDYKLATAFEALIGWLYLSEQAERLAEVVEEAIGILQVHSAAKQEARVKEKNHE